MKKAGFLKDNFIESSYFRHKKHQEEMLKKNSLKSTVWVDENNYDYWRHKRMYSLVNNLIVANDKWLTIGDGMGTDAHYLTSKGIKHVLATDISIARLKYAKNSFRYINQYKEENAEKLSFDDESFDYVMCKESLHHFPRPLIAVYEMLRVAKKGIVLIEPNDVKAFKDRRYVNHFESVGNYIYALSIREIEKITCALNMPAYAYKGFDDVYLSAGGSISMDSRNIRVKLCQIFLYLLNMATKIGVRESSLMGVIIFKTRLKDDLLKKLSMDDFSVVVNKKNPFNK